MWLVAVLARMNVFNLASKGWVFCKALVAEGDALQSTFLSHFPHPISVCAANWQRRAAFITIYLFYSFLLIIIVCFVIVFWISLVDVIPYIFLENNIDPFLKSRGY